MHPFACCDSRFFRALSDPNRLEIVGALALSRTPLSVSDLVERLAIDQSVVSRHLSQLAEAGLVTREKKGRHAFYSIAGAHISGLLRQIADCLDSAPCCCPPTKPKKGKRT